jgi:hypothetical protein
MYGVEQNNLTARNKALALAATIEASTLAIVPGAVNATGRRYARRLIFFNYIVMMEPIPRWIACRDHMV